MKTWMFEKAAIYSAKGSLGLWIILMTLSALAGGCSGEGNPIPEIVGTYDEFFNGIPANTTHVIGETLWTMTFQDGSQFIFHIKVINNLSDFLLAQNDSANTFSPNLFSRFDWTIFQNRLFYCQSVFNAPDLSAALDGSADRNDLASGCGGFSWSELVFSGN